MAVVPRPPVINPSLSGVSREDYISRRRLAHLLDASCPGIIVEPSSFSTPAQTRELFCLPACLPGSLDSLSLLDDRVFGPVFHTHHPHDRYPHISTARSSLKTNRRIFVDSCNAPIIGCCLVLSRPQPRSRCDPRCFCNQPAPSHRADTASNHILHQTASRCFKAPLKTHRKSVLSISKDHPALVASRPPSLAPTGSHARYPSLFLSLHDIVLTSDSSWVFSSLDYFF